MGWGEVKKPTVPEIFYVTGALQRWSHPKGFFIPILQNRVLSYREVKETHPILHSLETTQLGFEHSILCPSNLGPSTLLVPPQQGSMTGDGCLDLLLYCKSCTKDQLYLIGLKDKDSKLPALTVRSCHLDQVWSKCWCWVPYSPAGGQSQEVW